MLPMAVDTATLSRTLSFQPRRIKAATVTIMAAPIVIIAYTLTNGFNVTNANTASAKINETIIAQIVPSCNVRCNS